MIFEYIDTIVELLLHPRTVNNRGTLLYRVSADFDRVSYCPTVPDSVTSRGSATAKRAAAGQPRKNSGGPPLKTKAEKRAEAKALKARARARQKRRQALAVGGAAVVVLALVVGLIAWIGHSPDQSPVAGPSADVSSSAGAAASGAAFPPVPPGADPALSKKPTATAGAGAVTTLKTTTLKCIGAAGGKTASGTAIDLYSCVGDAMQQWTLPGDGTIRTAGKCMEVSSSGTADGTKVQLKQGLKVNIP